MRRLALGELARIVGGRLVQADPTVVVHGPVSIDSRAVQPNGLFAAFAGERVDGHDFAAAAAAAGAAAVLASRPVDAPAVVVPDVTAALAALARATLAAAGDTLTVVGVTGSSGKTTTKDLLAGLLRREAPTVAPPNSFNNEIGLPLTVLAADETTRYLVLEYSARRVGHIRALTQVAPPRVAAVLNVGSAHLGEFGSRAAIATAKGELVEALPADGVAVLNADDPLVAAMAGRTAARVLTFGLTAAADVRGGDVGLDAGGRPAFTVRAGEQSARVSLRLRGRHMVSNALAALGVVRALGLDLAAAAATLAELEPASRWRMEVHERPDGVTVVNDAYNANPESMRAALDALVDLAGGRRRAWAVLGEMAELGPATAAEHRALGAYAAERGVDEVVAVGAVAADVAAGAGERARRVPDADAALQALAGALRPGDVVLVKASRAAGLERVAAGLLDGAG